MNQNSKYNLKIIPFIFIMALMVAIPSFIIKWSAFMKNYERVINQQENEYKLKAENWSLKEKLKQKEIISKDSIKKNQQIENDLKNTDENPSQHEKPDPQAFLFEKPTKDIQILRPGEFFGGDIDEGAENLDWYGIFEQENKFTLKKIKLVIEPISWGSDTGDQKNGKLISTTIQAGAQIIFITGLKNIQEGEIESVKLEKKTLLPGEYMGIRFNTSCRSFFAYGSFNSSTGYALKNYLLEISSNDRENRCQFDNRKQIFTGTHNGGTIEFMWAGDIDRDGLLDLIMAEHFEGINISLFLSSKAENGKLIKIAAELTPSIYWGC